MRFRLRRAYDKIKISGNPVCVGEDLKFFSLSAVITKLMTNTLPLNESSSVWM